MGYVIALVALLVVMAGVIAYLGDRLGTLVGRRRLSLFGVRPRRTGQIVGVIAGILIMLVTLTVLSVAFQNATQTLLNAQRTADELVRLRAQEKVQQDKVNELNGQLEAARTELEQAQQTIAVAQSQRDVALSERDIAQGERDDLQDQRADLFDQVQSLEDQVNGIRTQLGKAQDQLVATRGDLAVAEAAQNEAMAARDQAQVEADAALAAAADAQQEATDLQAEVANVRGQLQAANEQLTTLQGDLTDAEARLAMAEARVTQAQADLVAAQAALADAGAARDAAVAARDDAESQAQAFETQARAFEGQVAALQDEVRSLESQQDALKDQAEALQAQATVLQSRNTELLGVNADLAQKNQLLDDQAALLQDQILVKNAEVQEQQQQVTTLNARLEDQARRLADLSAEIRNVSSGDIVFATDQLIYSGPIYSQDTADVRVELARFIADATAFVARRGVERIRVTSEQFNSLVDNISQTPGSDLVRLISPVNQFNSTIDVIVEAIENTQLFDKGQLIVSSQIHLGSSDLPVSQEELRNSLAQLKSEAVRKLRRAGLDEMQGPDFGDVTDDLFISLLLRLDGPATIGLVATDAIYRAGPAKLELLVLY